MGRPDVDPGAGFRIQPAAECPPAREDKAMLALTVDHGKLKVAVIRRGGNGFPHSARTLTAVMPPP